MLQKNIFTPRPVTYPQKNSLRVKAAQNNGLHYAKGVFYFPAKYRAGPALKPLRRDNRVYLKNTAHTIANIGIRTGSE